MMPTESRTGNGTATSPTVNNCGSVTYHPTYYKTQSEIKDEYDQAVKEIECLDDMMNERFEHKNSKYLRQHIELHHAKRAPMKHKKPHMNRRIIK